MIIKLQPGQIASFWDAIRHAVINANQIPSDREMECTNKVLEGLLSGKFQCWVVCDYVEEESTNKQIYAIVITSVSKHAYLGYDFLEIETVYGFRPMSNELALDGIDSIKRFAKANNCVKVQASTTVPRARELMSITGFTEDATIHSIKI